MTEFSFTVFYDPGGVNTDITDQIEMLEAVEVGSGEVNHAKIRLNSFFGQFINTAPVIDEFDLIRLSITDDAGPPNNTFTRTYEVDKIIPIESSQEGNVLEIELMGQEHWLQERHFAKQFYFENAFNVVRDIGDFYNADLGSLQPVLEDHDNGTGNKYPKWTSNTYQFNIAETFMYDGMTYINDRLGSTVQAGGAADFFELFFQDGSDETKFEMRSFVSGSLPASPLTITSTDVNNADPAEGGLERTSGNIVAMWGDNQFGSQPTNASRFHGELEAYNLHPFWDTTLPYKVGARVQFLDAGTLRHYERINFDTIPPGNIPSASANWIVITQDTVLGFDYSPWTRNIAFLWRNSGSSPLTHGGGPTDFDEPGCWDSNLVIVDGQAAGSKNRTWADLRVKSESDIPSDLLYLSGTGFYRGLRVLVDPNLGAPTGTFAGDDIAGNTFSKNVAQYDGTQWVVFRVFDDDDQVAIMQEGKVYERVAGSWTDVSGVDLGNDCFHRFNDIDNDLGVVDIVEGVAPFNYGIDSAVKYSYVFNPFDSVVAIPLNLATYYKIGCWANFRIPFPKTTQNGISPPFSLGFFYGNNAPDKEPATFDFNNMHITHSNNVGFNQDEAEEYGPASAVHFWARFIWKNINPLFAGNNERVFAGNFRFRCTLYDTSDNVVAQDFTIQFNDHWEEIILPKTGFQIYRARLPFRFANISQNIVLKQLDILNVFEWKNVCQCSIQLQEVYDDEGRYVPQGGRFGIQQGFLATLQLYIDEFYFVKPLLALTSVPTPVTDRAFEEDFMQQPFISNYVQLKQAALSQLEIEQFRHFQYDIRTEGRIDVNYGDSFFLENDQLTNRADRNESSPGANDGDPNTIKLVNKRTVYRITKPSGSPGQFERFLTGIKRFDA